MRLLRNWWARSVASVHSLVETASAIRSSVVEQNDELEVVGDQMASARAAAKRFQHSKSVTDLLHCWADCHASPLLHSTILKVRLRQRFAALTSPSSSNPMMFAKGLYIDTLACIS